ncbi:MAG: IS256 family transposase [Candidatus Dormibacteria bacterium]
MTPNSMPLDALLGYISSSDQDSLREILEHTLQALIEAEAAVVLGAQPHERTESRVGHRNGHRSRLLDTRVGRLELEIPKLRQGSFLPSLLEPRRRIERALWAVIQEAYVHGVSTRKVDDLVQAMGGCHVSKSEVSRICQELDVELALFRDRPLDDAVYPYVWFDATYEKVRQGGRIVSQAVVVAIGVRETGEKCVLGVAVGASETEAFWVEFCRQLVARGLRGVQLVISDAHEGLRSALAQCFTGASWQRCTVHFQRNVMAACSRQDGPAVLALVKTVFAQPSQQAASQAISQALELLEPRHPRVAKLLRDAESDILSYLAFPPEHWRSIRSTNALERVNAEIDRRAKVVGIFPNSASLLRLSTAVLQEQHDEWQDGRCHFSLQSMARLDPNSDPLLTNPLTAGLAA